MSMKTTGLRILDSTDDVLNVTLEDILKEFLNHKQFLWSVLFLDGISNKDQGIQLQQHQQEINKSVDGMPIEWGALIELSKRFFQMYETVVLGCKDPKFLRRYQDESEMYNNCDIVIELIDCVFWEVHSKDFEFIKRLQKKFKATESI